MPEGPLLPGLSIHPLNGIPIQPVHHCREDMCVRTISCSLSFLSPLASLSGHWSLWRKLASVTDAFRSRAGTTQWRWRQLSINEDKVVKLERGEWRDTRKKKEGVCSFHPQGKPPYVEGLKTKRTNQHTKLTNAEGAFFSPQWRHCLRSFKIPGQIGAEDQGFIKSRPASPGE